MVALSVGAAEQLRGDEVDRGEATGMTGVRCFAFLPMAGFS